MALSHHPHYAHRPLPLLALLSLLLPATPLAGASGVFSLLDYGGVGDGATDNSAAFARAVAAVAAAGGGTLVVPAAAPPAGGTYVTRGVNLTSGMTLLLGDGVVLRSSLDYAAWPLIPPLRAYPGDGPRYAPILGGYGVRDVRVLGNASAAATIDGLGLAWDAVSAAKLLKGQRPHVIEFAGSTNVEVAGIAIVQPAFWSVHFSECVSVHVHDATIVSATENGDGVDVGAQDVLLERLSISASDDAIAIKSGDAPAGSGLPPSRNITIRDCTLASAEACVAVGSEMTAGVQDVLVDNVTCTAAGHALLYVKARRDAGGFVRNVRVQDAVLSGPLERFLWVSQHFGEGGENVQVGDGTLPVVANISLARVAVTRGGVVVQAALLNGAVAPPGVGGAGAILGLALEDVFLGDATLLGWNCTNATGTYRNVTPAPCAAITPQ